jgi:hypothetical protein
VSRQFAVAVGSRKNLLARKKLTKFLKLRKFNFDLKTLEVGDKKLEIQLYN